MAFAQAQVKATRTALRPSNSSRLQIMTTKYGRSASSKAGGSIESRTIYSSICYLCSEPLTLRPRQETVARDLQTQSCSTHIHLEHGRKWTFGTASSSACGPSYLHSSVSRLTSRRTGQAMWCGKGRKLCYNILMPKCSEAGSFSQCCSVPTVVVSIRQCHVQ